MRTILLLAVILFLSCKERGIDQKPEQEIVLKGRTFVFHPENEKGELTVQFLDSTCHMFEVQEYNRPWRIVNFENSNTLVLGRLIIPLHKKNDSTIVGLNIGENDTKLVLSEKLPRWKLDEITGEWTEERWVGIENSEIPPPPARLPEHDTIWPPYYEIQSGKIISYCLGIDSVNIQMDNSLEYITMKSNLYNDFVGYQKDWRVLGVSDSVLTIQRRFTRDFSDSNSFSYSDSTETINLIKKR